MKTLKYFMLLILANTLIISCSSDDDNFNDTNIHNETEHLTLIQTISNESHKLAIFTENGKLVEGYNSICIQIKDHNDQLISNANRSEEHTSELQSRENLVCRLLLEKKKKK